LKCTNSTLRLFSRSLHIVHLVPFEILRNTFNCAKENITTETTKTHTLPVTFIIQKRPLVSSLAIYSAIAIDVFMVIERKKGKEE